MFSVILREGPRLCSGLDYLGIFIDFGVFSLSSTWQLPRRTVHHSTFLFLSVKGLVVFSGIFLLFKFSVRTDHFLHAIGIERGVNV